MFEQTFKNIDDILYKDAGADSELDYIGQTSWILFLKYLDDLEKDRIDEAELKRDTYNLILACTDGVKGDNEYGADPKAIV